MKVRYKVKDRLEIVLDTLPGFVVEVRNREEWIAMGAKLIYSIDIRHRPGYMHKEWFEEVGFDLEEEGCFPCYVWVRLHPRDTNFIDINWGDVVAMGADDLAEITYIEFLTSKLSFSEDKVQDQGGYGLCRGN